jgi:UDPglucose 6-dehydrogenase
MHYVKIAIIGLGFVGLSFAAVLGNKNFSVLGVDNNKKKISTIISGKTPFFEPKLAHTLKLALKKSLNIISDIDLAVNQCDLIFVTVGTPISKTNNINLNMLKSAIEKIGISLSKTKKKPIIIIKSTVIPGTTQKIVKPILEKKSKKLSSIGFSIITNPEFLREGSAIDDTLKPHLIVVGGNENVAIKQVLNFYKKLYSKKIKTIITNHQTAELIKYANNSFLATKISFINQIANICQSVPETNVDDVANAIGLDPRIGNLFLKAGPGYGGSCLPKDLQAMITFSSQIGSDPLLLKAVQQTNVFQITNILKLIEKLIGNIKRKNIAILGLSFKENSDDIRESVSIKLIELLLKKQANVSVFDPKAIENTRKIFHDKIRYADSINDVLINSQCAVIMTPWKQFQNIKNNTFKNMKTKYVIDTRRILKHDNLNIEYYAVGIGK